MTGGPELRLRGAREHNLRGVDLDLELGRWIAVTGPSGSGKTTLVFDTLVREGERRFLGSMSARARQFFGKLGRGEFDSLVGLPPTLSIGERATSPSARSTVGTQTGCLDLLRLVYARAARDPGGAILTRSHFSFNHPRGRCDACAGLGVEDRVDPELLVADPELSLRAGALVPTLPNGYTVYSQVTLEVMDTICRAHGFDVDVPWRELSEEQRGVILYGTRALKVPFGKHSIESRMKWEGITARPREEGYYRGLVPVIEETLTRNRNANILRFVRTCPCSTCGGSRLARAGREARVRGVALPELTGEPLETLRDRLQAFAGLAVFDALRGDLDARLERLSRLGLGHLTLARESTTLSGGEAQRVRLAAQLGAGLSGMLVALDEPTLGLHPEAREGMRAVLDELVEAGNTLVVVEHDPDMVRHADRVIALGPGGGVEGGRVVADDGAPAAPRAADPLGRCDGPRRSPRPGVGSLRLLGATRNNLVGDPFEVRLGALNVVRGPSGAGKSSLVFQTLLPALLGERGGPYEALEGWEAAAASHASAVDARPIGRTPRSTPATWSGLFDLVRRRLAATDEARALGLGAGHFSFNNKRGRCSVCEGLGVRRVGLHLFEDVELCCEACGGARYAPEVLEVRLRGASIADVLAMSFEEARAYFEDDAEPRDLCQAMCDLGLGYVTLGQSSATLSRGEAQRVKLATLLGSRRTRPTVVLLDEPDRGLAPDDVRALLAALDSLVEVGHTVVAVSHHELVWRVADHLVEVREGRVSVADLGEVATHSERRAPRPPSRPPAEIELRGVRTHNLRAIDVDLPRRGLTAICGVSGSGKTSLAFDTLAAEASRRFAESLPFAVRRHLRRLPAPELDSARGLTPTLALRQDPPRPGARSTVATQSELGPLLRLIFSRVGRVDGVPCGLSASHFSSERALGACSACGGRGEVERCDAGALVTHPERPLLAPRGEGALAGTRAGRHFSTPTDRHAATLARALAPRATLTDLERTPWRELDEELRRVALRGTGETVHKVSWELAGTAEGQDAHEFEAPWPGFLALVEEEARRRARSKSAASWREPLVAEPCPACAGSGLGNVARAVRVAGRTLPEVLDLPVGRLLAALEEGEGREDLVLAALLPEVRERVAELEALGLAHLELARSAQSLSTSELTRVRLASVLRAGLRGVTLVLDEPAAGLAGAEVDALLARLAAFEAEGNAVVLVSHRPRVLEACAHWIELGPGAGPEGGELVAAGPREEVLALDTKTARAVQRARAPRRAPRVLAGTPALQLRGLHEGPLAGSDIDLPRAGLVCVTGPAGSGKASLVFDVLGASVRARRAVGCEAVEVEGGLERYAEVHTGRRGTGGKTVLSTLGLAGPFSRLFAENDAGLAARAFQPGSAAGRCPTCKGSGREAVALDFLADLDLDCPVCDGTGFTPEVLAVEWRGRHVAAWLAAPARELSRALESARKVDPRLARGLRELDAFALGHLALGRRRVELSGGEAARLDLAASLAREGPATLFLFEEPARGLHEADLEGVLTALARATGRGDLVVAIEHRRSFVEAADLVLELGPVAGKAP